MGFRLPPKIEDGSAIVGVIGLGYVGLPLLHAFHRAGFRVIGFDVDPTGLLDALAGTARSCRAGAG